MEWKRLTESVWVYEDSCNVFAVRGEGGMLVVNAGTGQWLDRLAALPAPAVDLVCTHFFRDHSAGAALAAERGIRVHAPYWEQEMFADPEGLFQRRESYIVYDNIWDRFGPGSAIPVRSWLMDWETRVLAGIKVLVVPTPGVTVGGVSFGMDLDGRRVLFPGENVYAGGKIARVAPLQYNYNDLPGAYNLLYSMKSLLSLQPPVDTLFPSMGPPIDTSAPESLRTLSQSLAWTLAARHECAEGLAALEGDGLVKISDHLYQSSYGEANTYFLLSESGKALAIDYGYHRFHGKGGAYDFPRNRRSILHGIDGLQSRFGIDRIDAVLVTHYHDDHVNGIPLLQRLYQTRCIAGENFAWILEQPRASQFPCTWPEPIEVEAQALDAPFRWEEYTFTLYPMSGHTRWSTLIAFDVDGIRAVATGDQYFFLDDRHPESSPSMHNYVYRNGASLASYAESARLMESIQAQLVLPGHGRVWRGGAQLIRQITEYAELYAEIHRRLMPLGDEQAHCEVDSGAGWLEPYRMHLPTGGRRLEFTATIRNPFNRPVAARLRMRESLGWEGGENDVRLSPRGEARVRVELHVPAGASVRRHPVFLEAEIDGHPFGSIAEAIVTIGRPVF